MFGVQLGGAVEQSAGFGVSLPSVVSQSVSQLSQRHTSRTPGPGIPAGHPGRVSLEPHILPGCAGLPARPGTRLVCRWLYGARSCAMK